MSGGDMREQKLFTGVSLDQPSLIVRLTVEFLEASLEFRGNPKKYIKDAFKGDHVGGKRRMMLLRFGLAVGILTYCLVFAAMLILGQINRSVTETADGSNVLIVTPPLIARKDVSKLPKAKDDSGGGGGGGNESMTLPSHGVLPPASMSEQIVAPTTRHQPIAPLLPVQPTVWVDPALLKPPDVGPMGLPEGVIGPPSDGPGRNGGFGTGDEGGAGSGRGVGVGPGKGKGTGGDEYSPGGNRNARNQEPVDLKPAALNRPRPNYTEDARKNKVQGTVRLRVLVGSDGTVRQARPVTFLSDGLTEEALRAAMQMRFRPAMRNGQPVEYWVPVDIEFNLR
jgi:TonB family protein